MDLVHKKICPYECTFKSISGYCGRTAGCIYEVCKNYIDGKEVKPREDIRITNDGTNYLLYIGNKMVLKNKDIHPITRKIDEYEEEYHDKSGI